MGKQLRKLPPLYKLRQPTDIIFIFAVVTDKNSLTTSRINPNVEPQSWGTGLPHAHQIDSYLTNLWNQTDIRWCWINNDEGRGCSYRRAFLESGGMCSL